MNDSCRRKLNQWWDLPRCGGGLNFVFSESSSSSSLSRPSCPSPPRCPSIPPLSHSYRERCCLSYCCVSLNCRWQIEIPSSVALSSLFALHFLQWMIKFIFKLKNERSDKWKFQIELLEMFSHLNFNLYLLLGNSWRYRPRPCQSMGDRELRWRTHGACNRQGTEEFREIQIFSPVDQLIGEIQNFQLPFQTRKSRLPMHGACQSTGRREWCLESLIDHLQCLAMENQDFSANWIKWLPQFQVKTIVTS